MRTKWGREGGNCSVLDWDRGSGIHFFLVFNSVVVFIQHFHFSSVKQNNMASSRSKGKTFIRNANTMKIKIWNDLIRKL